jgi:hypothetical protein
MRSLKHAFISGRAALAAAGLLIGTLPILASSIIFSNLQMNSLLCQCAVGQGIGIGTSPTDPRKHFTRADAFTTQSWADFALDQLDLAVGLISGKPTR